RGAAATRLVAVTAAALLALATLRALALEAAATRAAFATAGTTEHLHVAGVLLHAALVGVLLGAQRAFDVDLPALLQVFTGDLRQFAEHLHAVPLGAFLALAALLVGPAFGSGHAQRGDRGAAAGVTHLRIVAEVADQNDLVDAACHGFASWLSQPHVRLD